MHLNIDRKHLQLGRRLMPYTLFGTVLVALPLCAMIVSLNCLASTVAAATPSPITVTEHDSGKTIEVAVGQKILLQLPSNPTTGYRWSVLGNPAPIEFVKSDYAADSQPAGRVGAGGTQGLRFTAKSPGKVELKLGYKRPWEQGTPPAKAFVVTIVVK